MYLSQPGSAPHVLIQNVPAQGTSFKSLETAIAKCGFGLSYSWLRLAVAMASAGPESSARVGVDYFSKVCSHIIYVIVFCSVSLCY